MLSIVLRPLAALLLTSTVLMMSATLACADDDAKPSSGKKLPMQELLPVGSILSRVSMSSYGGPKLSMLLTAESMEVLAPGEIAGKLLNIFLYGKDGKATLLSSDKATCFLDKKLVISHDKTSLKEETFSAYGTGLIMEADTKRGFLTGPVKTIIRIRPINP